MSKKNSLPPDVVKQWPEIFSDIEIKAVPLEYIDSMRVTFDDGKVWEIDIAKTRKNLTQEQQQQELEETLRTFIEEYSAVIKTVDFRLKTQKVISDMKDRTAKFMKKRK